MGDIMRPVPFQELIDRVFSEYRNHNSIFGIKKENFFRPDGRKRVDVFKQSCSMPLGPAAGPHTQLAQNIICAYLTGGRFFELKTVQIMDDLKIDKPCIDARDEGYNVEWSTEYTLPKAYDEYLKAWFVLHLLQTVFEGKAAERDFIFNMSVGYNLEGIKKPKMQDFINCMADASQGPLFEQYKTELRVAIDEGEFLEGTEFDMSNKGLAVLCDRISPIISPSVTISTMHGCPPKEIEAICSYMLTEKKLDTFVKLNPTLLGFDEVRRILDKVGFDYVGLKKESFEHDLQYEDAIAMLERLVALAKENGRGFGVKLTNTLGSVNDGAVLAGNEKYMSGRALLPISTAVAAKLSAHFNGELPISYSGGANAFTVEALFETGIRPITVATDMLKPGGYARLSQMAGLLAKSGEWKKTAIDPSAVLELSEHALENEWQQKAFRGDKQAKAKDALPMFDCYVSPCMQACPIHQNIPDYISLVGEGKYASALSVILEGNALPNITCNICDHKCQSACARMDYEGAVQIRELKKIAVEKGSAEFLEKWESLDEPADVKAAVVGAGPAGLSAAYFLARAGFKVTVYEKEESAGGVVRHVIPSFRIDLEAIEADIRFIQMHGVVFHFGAKTEDTTVTNLKEAGFDYIFYAVGNGKDNGLELQGGSKGVMPALAFLSAYRRDAKVLELGSHVVVCGGGNTAMDSARAAKRVAGVDDVTVVYRRTEKEMPADEEEFNLAKEEGIGFIFLANPVKLENGKLLCMEMKLGEPDESGRRRPVETGNTFEIPCNTLIPATGGHNDVLLLDVLGLEGDKKGWPVCDAKTGATAIEGVYSIGDFKTGPSTVVGCIESARSAVEDAIDKVLASIEEGDDECDCDDDDCDCGDECHCHDDDCHCHDDGCHCHDDDCHCHDEECHCHDGECHCHDEEEDEDGEELQEAENKFFADINERKTHVVTSPCSDFERCEAKRCMDCMYLCNRCVEVCPNRANVEIDMRFSEFTEDPFQILHLDAFCNECGNCATFCGHEGKPYRDKFTLFSRQEDFDNSTNSGFFVEGDQVAVRIEKNIIACHIDRDGNLVGEVPDLVRDLIEQVFVSYDYLLGRVEE